jgi:5-aminolevulinate synthase
LRRSSHERLAQQRQATKLRAKLYEVGLPVLEGNTHIIPIMVKDAAKCSQICQTLLSDFGIYVQPINFPTVPVGSERLRLTPGPLHTDSMIDHLVDSLQKAFALAGDAQALQTG